MAKPKISGIVDALEMVSEQSAAFLDIETGEAVHVELSMLREAEEEEEQPEDLLDWEQDPWHAAVVVARQPERFKPLPSKFDIHEWEIMRQFALSAKGEQAREELHRAIHGRGAFRAFRDALDRWKLREDWFAFRAAEFRRIAVEWCEEQGLEWE